MKKHFLFTLSLFLTFSVFSQNLNISGAPVSGTKDDFFKTLISKGYTKHTDTSCIGTFYSHPNSVARPIGSDKNNITGAVVELPSAQDWKTLSEAYYTLKNEISKEYGDVANAQETFDQPTQPSTDEQRYRLVNMDKCTYASTWLAADGIITLIMIHSDDNGNSVKVIYFGSEISNSIYTALNTHIKFKGITLDVNSKEFVSKLEQQGFSYVRKSDNFIIMKGDFAGYSDCQLFIDVLEPNDVIKAVNVSFPYLSTWSQLEANYR